MNDRLTRALRSEPTDRRPVWLMRQAGRYLPEYRELRARHRFEELCADPELAADVTLMPIERFPLDGAIIFADLMSPVSALGIDVRFDPGPVLDTPLDDPARIRALPEPERGAIAPEVPAALRIVRERLAGRAALLGFAGAPWSIAAYLVQGRGRSGFPALRTLAAREPELTEELLAKLSRMSARFLLDQIDAGADAVQIFDTWAGLLPLATWERLVKPHIVSLLETVGSAGVPRIYFAQDAPHLLPGIADLPTEAFSFDWRVDLAAMRRTLPEGRAIQGNIDPAILSAGPEATKAATRQLLARMPALGHVVNLGHGIMPEAPIASVEALVRAVHDEGAES